MPPEGTSGPAPGQGTKKERFKSRRIMCRPTHRPTVGRLSTDCRPTVDCQSTVGRCVDRHFFADSRPTVGGEDDSRSTVGPQSVDSRSTVDRQEAKVHMSRPDDGE